MAARFVLAPTMYHQTWNGLQVAPPGVKEKLQGLLAFQENILLFQMRIGILFPLFLIIGLMARGSNAGMHKRMMFLATAMAMPAGIDRIAWLPTTMPTSALAVDLYTLAVVSPLFVWDVIRNRSIHPAYWIWLGVNLPFSIFVQSAFDTPWWHQAAKQIMGVG